jgi:hypothetical protein
MKRAILGLLCTLALVGLAALLWLTSGEAGSRGASLDARETLSADATKLSEPLDAPAASSTPEAIRSRSTHPLLQAPRDGAGIPWSSAGCVLSGRVEDPAGQPLPGVEVVATLDAEVRSIGSILEQITAARRGGSSTRTDAEGRFVLRDLPRTPLRVRAYRDDGAQIERSLVRAAPPEEQVEPLVLRFELGLELTILYRDRAGLPLAGRHLAALRNLEDQVLGLESTALTTDAEGVARAVGLAPGRYTLLAFPDAGALQVLRDDLQLVTDTRLEIESGGTGRLELHVHDAQRSPIANAHLLALLGSGRRGGLVHGTTDAQGLLVLPHAPLGKLQLAFVHAAGYTSWPPSPENLGAHEVREDQTCRLEIELAGVRRLRGRLLHAATGAPLADVELSFRSAAHPRGEIAGRARSDAQGAFVVERLPRERLHLSLASAQLVPIEPELAPLQLFANREETGAWDWLDLSAADAPEEVELRVPAPGVLEGVVRDESGAIVPQLALVAQLERRGFRCRVEARSDERGRFRFAGLPTPGTWEIAPLRAMAGTEPLEQKLEPGASASDLVLRLSSGLVLRGTVSGAGVPVAGARLVVVTSNDQKIERRTDARGAFEIALATPRLRLLRVEAQGFARHEQPLEVQDGALAPLSIELARAIELQGRVLDGERAPLARAQVQWFPLSAERKRKGKPEHARSDANGEFRFGALKEGAGELEVQLPGHRPWLRAFEDPSAAKNIEVTLDRGLSLSGVVRLPDGNPAVGANVYVSGAGAPPSRMATRDDGSFEFPGLNEGSCSIYASPPEGSTALALRASEPLQVAAGTAGLELRLRVGALISGSVDASELTGVALPTVRIVAIDAAQRELASSRPNAEGRFTLSGLDPDVELRLLVSGANGAIRHQAFGPYRPGQDIGPLRLQQGTLLTGRVVNRAGEPVAGIRITCHDTGDVAGLTPPQVASSGPDGRFAFVGCSPNALQLVFLLPTKPLRKQVVDGVRAGETALEVTLDL